MLTCDEYLTATSLDEAFDMIERHKGRYRLVAGATDILPWARDGRAGDVHIPVLIDIAAIPELKQREVAGSRVRLGAATPVQRFLDDAVLVGTLPVMPYMATWFADDQIRGSATIGGNLVNASPAADGTPAMLVHGARVELASRRGDRIARRTVGLAEFVRGPGKTMIDDGEILVAVECETAAGCGAAFEKVGHRRSLVISTVCLAALVRLDATRKRCTEVRIAVGGIGPVPVRIRDAEALLEGSPLSSALLAHAAEIPVALVASRTRQTYRHDVVRGFAMRALVNAARRAGLDGSVITPEFEAAYA